MVKNWLRNLLSIFILTSLTAGFRVFSERWDISRESSTIWLKFSADDLVIPFSETDFDNESYSPLAGISDDLQRLTIMQEIINDFNSVDTAYIRLALYPVTVAQAPAGDTLGTPFNKDIAANRTINITRSGGSVFVAGSAQLKVKARSDQIIGCSINISQNVYRSAKQFKATVTHEIGHCIGLKHNHSDKEAIMSYNSSRKHYLGVDEKLGLTYLYPAEDEFKQEAATFGLACKRR